MSQFAGLLIVPIIGGVTFIIFGTIMSLFPPGSINGIYGYRTSESMKTQERWDFSQKYASKKMIQIGVLLSLSTFIGLVINPNSNIHFILEFGLVIISSIYLIVIIENALKRKFGKNSSI